MHFGPLKRREFIALLGGTAAWPIAARAQQPGRIYRLALLLPTEDNSAAMIAFFDELRLNGFVEGQLTINARAILDRVEALRLPAMHQWPETAEIGGMIGYGPRFTGVFRQRARLVARVLRGAKPAEIPVEQPTHFELVINLKAASAIGHEIPAGLVLRADAVIE